MHKFQSNWSQWIFWSESTSQKLPYHKQSNFSIDIDRLRDMIRIVDPYCFIYFNRIIKKFSISLLFAHLFVCLFICLRTNPHYNLEMLRDRLPVYTSTHQNNLLLWHISGSTDFLDASLIWWFITFHGREFCRSINFCVSSSSLSFFSMGWNKVPFCVLFTFIYDS